MSENSKIEWCDHTFNPWEGCTKVGPGCDHCYAETRNARFAGGASVNWGPGAPRRRTSAANWRKPLAWDAAATAFQAEHGRRQRVFCASLADVFDNEVDPAWRADLADLIQATPNLDWLLLTKRIGNAGAMLGEMFLNGTPSNILLGATIVNQVEADRDIPKLARVAVERRFLSMEPVLGAVDLTGNCRPWGENGASAAMLSRIHWVIVGGESGSGARPMSPDWARSLRDQCAAVGIPFLFKQWGEWAPLAADTYSQAERVPTIGDDIHVMRSGNICAAGAFQLQPGEVYMRRYGKKAAGRQLDGMQHDGYPEVP